MTTYFFSPATRAAVHRIPLFLVCCAIGLQACSTLAGYETPSVSITSVRTVRSEGALPDFVIGLRVINPNRNPLPIQGVSYAIRLAGNEIIRGVGNDFPVIEGYGQADLSITASADLFAGIRLFSELLRSPQDNVDYDVDARLDLGGLRPNLRVRDRGNLSLNNLNKSLDDLNRN